MSFLLNFLSKFFSASDSSANSSTTALVESAKSKMDNEGADVEFLPGSGLKNFNIPSNPSPFFHDNDFNDSF